MIPQVTIPAPNETSVFLVPILYDDFQVSHSLALLTGSLYNHVSRVTESGLVM